MKTVMFENYPWWMVTVSNAINFAIYAIGIFLMSRMGAIWAALYAGYCIWMELRVLAGSCPSCYYYGKRCAFGKGQISAWFFKITEGTLSAKRISWVDILPDFMVSLMPLGVGIALLFRSFSWAVLLLLVVLTGLGSAGTGFVRGQLACRYCKQRELGCPAEQLFNKSKSV